MTAIDDLIRFIPETPLPLKICDCAADFKESLLRMSGDRENTRGYMRLTRPAESRQCLIGDVYYHD